MDRYKFYMAQTERCQEVINEMNECRNMCIELANFGDE